MKRHPFDPWSFVLGLFFLATGVAFLTNSVDLLHSGAARLWPIPVLTIGLSIILTGVRRVRQRQPQPQPADTEQHPSAETEGELTSPAAPDLPA